MISAVDLVAAWEGFSSRVYYCQAGVLTCGWGSTRDADGKPFTTSATLSPAQARVLLARDLLAAEATIKLHVKVPLTEGMRTALCSFIYNVGGNAFARSTLLRLLNRGEPAAVVAAQLARWNLANGKISLGLSRRRAAERAVFLSV